jgi:hypothetical protein
MKPTELRIGNWINTIEGPARIKAVSNEGVITTTIMTRGDHLEFAKPIPLTEEILLSAGFHKSYAHRNPQFVLPINWPFVHEVRTELLCLELVEGKFTSEHCFNRVILYVHQLQNLIFALTGQELEIKL